MWHGAYRALEHGRARSACRQAQNMPEFPAGIRNFADVFVVSQVERQKADYALDADAYLKSDVLEHIVAAELAFSWFERTHIEARRSFVAHVLFRQRSP